jgi:sarcosine oxidase subunit gamma
MLNYNSPINNHIEYNDISVKEVSPIMKLNLRGKKREFFTTVGKQLDMILPTEANTSSSSSKLTSIWLSPDEWMIVSNEKTEKDTNNYDLEEIYIKVFQKLI